VSAPDFSTLRWIKSSRSANNGTCVEVAALGHQVAIRDSKNPDGVVLVFESASFRSFLDGLSRHRH
jgi:Domain of unknown function (DUF397)